MRGSYTYRHTQTQAQVNRSTFSGIMTAPRMPSSFAMVTQFLEMKKGAHLLIRKVETYVLDGNNTSSIPLPHDCEIKV